MSQCLYSDVSVLVCVQVCVCVYVCGCVCVLPGKMVLTVRLDTQVFSSSPAEQSSLPSQAWSKGMNLTELEQKKNLLSINCLTGGGEERRGRGRERRQGTGERGEGRGEERGVENPLEFYVVLLNYK